MSNSWITVTNDAGETFDAYVSLPPTGKGGNRFDQSTFFICRRCAMEHAHHDGRKLHPAARTDR